MQTYDVIIAGGGMVGLAVACGLQGSGMNIAVLRARTCRRPSWLSSLRFGFPPSTPPANVCCSILVSGSDSRQHAPAPITVWKSGTATALVTLLLMMGSKGWRISVTLSKIAVIHQALWQKAQRAERYHADCTGRASAGGLWRQRSLRHPERWQHDECPSAGGGRWRQLLAA